KINNLKYTSSLTLSLIGSEAFKLGSSIFIFKFTGDLHENKDIKITKPEPETDIPLLEFLLNIFSNKTNDSNSVNLIFQEKTLG
ncbi:hypothetical protein, partial [Mycoplasmopsis bovis]|uniref:hypothetical protein n=1 Tax=Mycoplasmopsis bovis TaxID=28903 RepID=UPI003D2D88C9